MKTADLILPSQPVDYADAHELQLELHAQVSSAERPDTLILLEHPPVITIGRYGDEGGILATREDLSRGRVEVRRIERGGQTTYHGPGQLVGYPIWQLAGTGLGVRRYVGMLEEVMIEAALRLGVTIKRREGFQGVFHETGKCGAVGVAVRKGVTMHGFSLNISPELSHYRWIVPCGLQETATTSLEAIKGETVSMEGARAAAINAFEAIFSVRLSEVGAPEAHGTP